VGLHRQPIRGRRVDTGSVTPGPVITLRRLARSDFPLLARWLAEPHVARWWAHETTPEALEADFGPDVDGLERSEVFIAAHGGAPIGLIQRFRCADYAQTRDEMAALAPVPEAAISIDYFIGEPQLLRRGLGSAMIRTCVHGAWRDWPDADAVVVAVHADNEASWRVLARAGFRRVGCGAMTPDNPLDDERHLVYRLDRGTCEVVSRCNNP
jgi:aminoglycoside 6'-N-acetyltransferase